MKTEKIIDDIIDLLRSNSYLTKDNLIIIKKTIKAVIKSQNCGTNKKKRYYSNYDLIEVSVLLQCINKIHPKSPENDENIIVIEKNKYKFHELKYGFPCDYCDLTQGNCDKAICDELIRKDKRRGYFKLIKPFIPCQQ